MKLLKELIHSLEYIIDMILGVFFVSIFIIYVSFKEKKV